MNAPNFSDWIGRSHEISDRISSCLVKRIAATLSESVPREGDELPLLWHWAFFQEPVSEEGLGPDGHPALGGFLPPSTGRNRMWAGSRLTFQYPLKVEADVLKRSTIIHIEEKHGRTGSLLFVTLQHDYIQDGQLALQEQQDIVYRDPTPPKLTGTSAEVDQEWAETISPSPTLLFRYSAVTFNGHRIHYDVPYVTESEGYPGLVVHGPLIATLNLRAFKKAHPKAQIKAFSFKGVRPLISPKPFEVAGKVTNEGLAQVWAYDDAGVAQVGEIQFTSENPNDHI